MLLDRKRINRKLKGSYALSTIFYFFRQCVVEPLRARGSDPIVSEMPQANFRLRAAVICDEMTWQNCKCLFQEAYFLTPRNWRETLERHKPNLLFCESTWEGMEEVRYIWSGRVFRNHRVLFENRKALLGIIARCKEQGIPTVFWNKEDPVYYRDQYCDFTDTALLFDHVFTTAQECVGGYEKSGHKSVHVMPFGFSPRMFHPLGRSENACGAVYTGSWYSEHQQRCKDMRLAFGWLKERGIPLTIYDRQYQANGTPSFPKEYWPYVRPMAGYERMGEIYRKYAVGVNINTVKESETMFSRRVYEMMACGLPVVSNESLGMKNRFGDAVAFVEEPGCEIASSERAHELLRKVFLHDTFDIRMKQMLEIVGIPQENVTPTVDVFCMGETAQRVFEEIDWPAKRRIPVTSEAGLKKALAGMDGKYGIVLNEHSQCPDIKFYMTQFAFLPAECGVGTGGDRYRIGMGNTCFDILWPKAALMGDLTESKYWYSC